MCDHSTNASDIVWNFKWRKIELINKWIYNQREEKLYQGHFINYVQFNDNKKKKKYHC